MSKFSCDVCMELILLVKNDVANSDSKALVKEHMEFCPACKQAFNETMVERPKIDDTAALKRIKKSLTLTAIAIALLGAFVGVNIIDGEHQFYNIIIMPLIGAIGYFAIAGKSIFLPINIILLNLIRGTISNGIDDFARTLLVSLSFAGLCLIGTIIGFLLKFVFKKVGKIKKVAKIIAGTLAFVLIAGVSYIAIGYLGNPVSTAIAKRNGIKYVQETYPDLELECDGARYELKFGAYVVSFSSPTSIDTHFTLQYSRFGKLDSDNYEMEVSDGSNTHQRIDMQYANSVEKAISFPDFPLKTVKYCSGNINWFRENKYELDKKYDLYELGKTNGHISVTVESDVVDVKTASEMILKMKESFDQKGVTFKEMSFQLQKPGTLDVFDENAFPVLSLKSDDIYSEGFEERLLAIEKTAREENLKYNAQKQAETEAYISESKANEEMKK